MKIKTILTLGLVAILLLLATGCGPSEQEQQYLDAAREVAESVPLPTYYCPVHGLACEPEEIAVEISGYNTLTGKPYLRITGGMRCPEANPWNFWSSCAYLGGGGGINHLELCAATWIEAEVWRDGTVYTGYFKEFYLVPLDYLTDDTITKYWR